MLVRVRKFWRDHVFSSRHDFELRVALAEAPYKLSAVEHGLTFFAVTRSDDPKLKMLDRDFPRQSRTFRRDIEAGCVMVILGDDDRTMGYFFAATRDFFDQAQYRLTFPAGDGRVYAFNFYVDPAHRSKPIARVLLGEGFRYLHEQGHTELIALCRSTEKALLRLYRHFKLLPTGRAVDCYRILHRRFSRWTESRDTGTKRP